MTTPNINLPEWAAAQDQPWVTENEAKNIIDVLLPGVVVSDALNTPPAAPAAGSLYIVAGSASGAWAGWEDKLAAYIDGAWVQVVPQEGWVFWVISNAGRSAYTGGAWVVQIGEAPLDGVAYARQSGAWVEAVTSGGMYDMEVVLSGAATASQVIYSRLLGRNAEFAANFSGSVGKVGTNPTATFDLDVQADGSNIGTISISTSGAVSFSTAGGVVKNVLAGSVIEVIAPAIVDATAADISVDIIGKTDGGTYIAVVLPSSNKWRLLITGVVNGLQPTIAEIEMRQTIGGINACTGGTPSASSYQLSPAEIPDAAFDGNPATQWTAAGTDIAGPWIEYTFASPVAIRQIAIQAVAIYTQYSPSDFSFQYWDGAVWITSLTVTGEPEPTAGQIRTYNLP